MSDNTETSSNSSASDEQTTFALARKVQLWLEIMSHPVAPPVFYTLLQSSIAALGAFCLETDQTKIPATLEVIFAGSLPMSLIAYCVNLHQRNSNEVNQAYNEWIKQATFFLTIGIPSPFIGSAILNNTDNPSIIVTYWASGFILSPLLLALSISVMAALLHHLKVLYSFTQNGTKLLSTLDIEKQAGALEMRQTTFTNPMIWPVKTERSKEKDDKNLDNSGL